MPTQTRKSKNYNSKSKQSKSFKNSKFSRNQLIAFVLVFAAIGGILIFRSFAAAPVVATKQGETMVPYMVTTVSVINDKTASGGQFVRDNTNQGLGGSVPLFVNSTGLSVIARATSCSGGWPWLSIVTSGVTDLPNTKISSTSWKTYSSNIPTVYNYPDETYVSLYVTNNGYANSSCSRHLDIDVITYYGANTKAASMTLQGLTKL